MMYKSTDSNPLIIIGMKVYCQTYENCSRRVYASSPITAINMAFIYHTIVHLRHQILCSHKSWTTCKIISILSKTKLL